MRENSSIFAAVLLCALAAPPTIVAQRTASPAGDRGLRTVQDVQDRLSFQVPSTWPLAARDRELSTFHQEARSAPPTARIRYVAAMPENPFPMSTFSGAHFYVSATPRQTQAQCAAQTARMPGSQSSSQDRVAIDHLAASHVHDEHGTICTQFRDDVYTVYRRGACLRFDLAMNNFCGGEVSSVPDMSLAEVQAIHHELETILNSVSFQP